MTVTQGTQAVGSRSGGFVVLDGGLATELERRGADLADRLWSARLLIDDPDLIRQVHRDYFAAGAQVAITASYQASVEGFAERGIDAPHAEALLTRSVRLAREARDEAAHSSANGTELLVAASIGPYGATKADGSEYTGDYGETGLDDLVRFHRRRAGVLAAAGPDLFAVETIPSFEEARALALVLADLPDTPAWVSFSCRDEGHLADGTPIEDAVRAVAGTPSVIAVGVNCTPGQFIAPLLDRVRAVTSLPAVAYPNVGGTWDPAGRRWIADADPAPGALAAAAPTWCSGGAEWIGGCCGFGVEAIAGLAALARSTAERGSAITLEGDG